MKPEPILINTLEMSLLERVLMIAAGILTVGWVA
jgi:hypothetical protein